MGYLRFLLAVVLVSFASVVSAEVYDLDALTEGYEETNTNTQNTDPVDTTNTNTTTKSEPSEAALTLAECIIYQRLEIEDARCTELLRDFSCSEYAGCLSACAGYVITCYSEEVYSQCVAEKLSCLDSCSYDFPQCAATYPPTVNNAAAKPLPLSDPVGDVRITYEDNPRAVDMETVSKSRDIHAGAAIFTGDKGSVMLTLPNGSTQYIGPNSYFRIAEYIDTDTTAQTYTILENGNIKVRLENPETQKVGYVVMTPLGSVRATGTEFELTVNTNGTMELESFEGDVEILDTAGNLLNVVSAGQTMVQAASGTMTFYKDGQVIATWEPTTAATNNNSSWLWIGGVTIGGLIVIILLGVFIVRRKRPVV